MLIQFKKIIANNLQNKIAKEAENPMAQFFSRSYTMRVYTYV
jgi:hypothetical protein